MRSGLGQTSRVGEIPPPVGGWNARDPLQAMKRTDAVILDNFIPGPGGVALRGGSANWVTGFKTPIRGLLRFNAPGQAPRLFACTSGQIYDVTASGGAVQVAGPFGSDVWRGTMFGTPGGAFLIAANSADNPLHYDGANWLAIKWAAISGYPYTLTPGKMTAPTVFGSRLWFVERGSLRVWFKPVLQVDTAPASGSTDPSVYDQCLDFASQCRLGGQLVAMGVWTRDGGTGSDDFAVFVTSSGEVLVYQGTDPTSTTAWSRVGVFRIAPPIGDRPLVNAGADLAVLTETGLLPLSQVLPLTLSQDGEVAITDKIRGAFQSAYQSAPVAFGWGAHEYPMGGLVIVNVPQSDGTVQQFVMHVVTRAWCRFLGLPALCWALLGDHAFFGTADGRVVQFDVGSSDNGAPIQATALPAFSDFKAFGRKTFRQARPLFYSALGYRPPVKLKVDYDTSRDALPQPPVAAGGTPWGSPWNSPWGPRLAPSSHWQGVRGSGLVASILVCVSSLNPFRLDKIDVLFEGSSDPL